MKHLYQLLLLIILNCNFVFGQDHTTAISYYTSGLEDYSSGNYDEAIEHYTKAIDINSEFAEAFFKEVVQGTTSMIIKEQ